MTFKILRKGAQFKDKAAAPFVRIVRTGHLILNKSLSVWLAERGATAVQIAYENESDTLALLPCKRGKQYSYCVDLRVSQASVTIRSALKWMSDPAAGRYDAVINGEQIEVWLTRWRHP